MPFNTRKEELKGRREEFKNSVENMEHVRAYTLVVTQSSLLVGTVMEHVGSLCDYFCAFILLPDFHKIL